MSEYAELKARLLKFDFSVQEVIDAIRALKGKSHE